MIGANRSVAIVARVPVYPPLVAVSSILAVFGDSTAAAEVLLRPLLIAFLVAVLVQFGATALTRSRHSGAAIAALLVMVVVQPIAVLAILVPLTVILTLRVVRRQGLRELGFMRWTKPLNVIAGLTVLVGAVGAGSVGALSIHDRAASAANAGAAPDVYILMFDAYPRADTLLRDFGFDNGAFLDRMASKGFELSALSRSNYNATALTLATMFNMVHVHSLVDKAPTEPAAQFRLMSALLNDGRGFDVLRRHGYEVVAVASPISNVTLFSADRLIDDGGVTDLELDVLQAGLLPDILPDLQRTWLSNSLRDRVQHGLASVPAIAAERVNHPRFVFGHFMSPHAPTLFARDGSHQDPWPCFPRACRAFYGGQHYGDAVIGPSLSQIEWINGQIELVTSRLLAATERPPVIIVLSDHGYRHDFGDTSEMIKNMFMAYTPDHTGLFPADSTPVNILPRLLNAYLGEDIPLATDESWVLDMSTVTRDGLLKLEPWRP